MQGALIISYLLKHICMPYFTEHLFDILENIAEAEFEVTKFYFKELFHG